MPITCDRRVFDRRMERTREAGPSARIDSLRAAGDLFARIVGKIAPRDTNRYVNGWMMAANAAGCGKHQVSPLQASRYRDTAEETLQRQLEYWGRAVDHWASQIKFWEGAAQRQQGGLKGGQRYRANQAGREHAKAQHAFKRAAEEMEKLTDTSVVIGLYAAPGQKIVNGKARGRRINTFAYEAKETYGGTGMVRDLPRGGAELVLHNREPHTSLVEKRTHVVRFANAYLRSFGVRRVAARYAKIIDAAQG